METGKINDKDIVFESLRSVWFWYHCKKRKKEFIVDRNVIFLLSLSRYSCLPPGL